MSRRETVKIELSAAGLVEQASRVLSSYKLATDMSLYLVGAFDAHVTLLSQQIRALNLAWSLIESCVVPMGRESRKKLAIVGAGFAGLTLAAALLQKRTALDIAIFEERDTLLPLQQGSDSRWLHPQIYDWPSEGSEASAAMLPVLNWTAGRASDVVVQALSEWQRVVKDEKPSKQNLRLFCNTRHLQIDRCPNDAKKARIEWVGEPRNSFDGTAIPGEAAAGSSESFDFIVMAVGFGLELHTESSYWRNETLGQPSLSQARGTFLVSGQGDGAMIDLLRLRISQYRQDRILDELFAGKENLLKELKNIRAAVSHCGAGATLFERFEALDKASETVASQLRSLIEGLRHRLRRDTDAILHLKVRNLADLFDGQVSRMSFQNALLVYLLYKCGGFAPSTEEEAALITRLAIKPEHVIRRHGTNRREQFRRLLSEELYDVIEADQKPKGPDRLHQSADIQWTGGYFGIPGRLSDIDTVPDSERKTWRKEYLPGPTALLATTLCGAVVGAVNRFHPKAAHFRVTLHRVLNIHKEELLQQACDYLGRGLDSGPSGAGRTFPTTVATIGLAYVCRGIVRSREGVAPEALRAIMSEQLNLNKASREMAREVGFVLAIPILQPSSSFFRPSPVAGVMYIDSKTRDFWLSDTQVSELCDLIHHALDGFKDHANRSFNRLRNIRLSDTASEARTLAKLPEKAMDQLELVDVSPPATDAAFHFNFEHSDLTPVASASGGSVAPTREPCNA